MHDALLRTVQWQDLLQLRKREILHELLISSPWFAASLLAFSADYYPLAFFASFMFFLAGLRQVHNAFHHSLGLPRWMSDWMMFAQSIFMLGSMHAVQINHLRHHQHCMADDDVEAMGARLSAWGALLLGPRYPIELHRKALQLASPLQRRWIHAELVANVAWAAAVFLIFDSAALKYHFIAMAVGQCFTAFFAVWTTHHHCDKDGLLARSIRNHLKATLTYNMFYHFEHHTFPAVPTCKLPELAKRLDAVAPTLGLKMVY